jgi:hypothetical protein
VAPATKKLLTTLAGLALLLALLWAQQQGWLGQPPASAPSSGTVPTSPRAPEAPRASRAGYAPASPAPKDALPGGSLEAHEGRGGHTIERHVGRTPEQLRMRLEAEDKREVSTFPDLATAERLIARALFERRRDVNAWLEAGARGDTSVTWRGADVAGRVLRDGAGSPVPGRTVHVVLYPSNRFPEGFAIRTAYVRLP